MYFERKMKQIMTGDPVENSSILKDEVESLIQSGVITVETSTWGSIDTDTLLSIIYLFTETIKIENQRDGVVDLKGTVDKVGETALHKLHGLKHARLLPYKDRLYYTLDNKTFRSLLELVTGKPTGRPKPSDHINIAIIKENVRRTSKDKGLFEVYLNTPVESLLLDNSNHAITKLVLKTPRGMGFLHDLQEELGRVYTVGIRIPATGITLDLEEFHNELQHYTLEECSELTDVFEESKDGILFKIVIQKSTP